MRFFGLKFSEHFTERDVFNNDLRKSAYTKNPKIRPDIDLVYVLSGRSTALGVDADGLKRKFDLLDDIERLREGIRVATVVNALRANKQVEDLKPEDYVTKIFYNGRTIHNQHLRQALQQGLLNYPAELFIIRDINPENTIGQIQSFKEYMSSNQHKNIAIISSAYHLARVARTIGNSSPQAVDKNGNLHAIGELNFYLYGVHKNENRLGMLKDLKGEHQAMQRYSSGAVPSISRLQSSNVFFTDEDFYSYKSFAYALAWGNRTPGKIKKLIFAIDIIRHGDRTPLKKIPTVNYQWTQGLGELTTLGELQEYQLGQCQREKYIHQYQLLPPHYSPETMYVRSSDARRTLMSAESFLAGLYPLDTRIKSQRVSEARRSVPIEYKSKAQDNLLRPDPEESKFESFLKNNISSASEWKKMNDELKPSYGSWSQAMDIDIKNLGDLVTLSNTLFIHQLYKIPPPPALNLDDVQKIIKAGAWAWTAIYNHPSIYTPGSINLFNSITYALHRASLKNSSLKYILYSAHDSTIAAQMAFMGFPLDKIPKYASNLSFSLFDRGNEQYTVEVSYNNQVITDSDFKRDEYSIDQLLELKNQKNHTKHDQTFSNIQHGMGFFRSSLEENKCYTSNQFSFEMVASL